MSAVFILVALSAAMGFTLSALTWWPPVIASGVMLAALSAMVLQIEGFSDIPGIAIITVCLTMSQVAYPIGLVRRGSRSIAGKSQQKQRSPSQFI
jgi:hypothetical protein